MAEGRLQLLGFAAGGGGAGGEAGDVEPLPLAQGHGRLSQFIFSQAPEAQSQQLRSRQLHADTMQIFGQADVRDEPALALVPQPEVG